MKNILLFFLFSLTSILFSQSKIDTIVDASGQISFIHYSHKIDVAKLTKSERFQRGLTLESEAWELDSMSVFDRAGKLIHTRPATHFKRPKSTGNKRATTTGFPPVDITQPNRHHFNDKLSAIELINISGYAGKEASGTLNLWVTGEEDYPISVLEKTTHISIKGLGKTLSPGANNFDLTVKLSPGVSQQVIRLAGPDQKVYDIRLALRGYDLSEADFTAGINLSNLKQFDASEREHLFLRLESTEKLLNLYQGDKLRYHFPVGRQIDQIPVYHLPPGTYRMEVIDLSTGEKRSYGLKR